MPTVEQAEAVLRKACPGREGCALDRFWQACAEPLFDSFTSTAIHNGLCDSEAQAWAIMAGWDDVGLPMLYGLRRYESRWDDVGLPMLYGLRRYESRWDAVREAEWYELGKRLAREFGP